MPMIMQQTVESRQKRDQIVHTVKDPTKIYTPLKACNCHRQKCKRIQNKSHRADSMIDQQYPMPSVSQWANAPVAYETAALSASKLLYITINDSQVVLAEKLNHDFFADLW